MPNHIILYVLEDNGFSLSCIIGQNVLDTGGLSLVGIWSPTPDVSIQVVYPYLNQGEWVPCLVNSQQKLDSMVDGRAQDQLKTKQYCLRKQKKTKKIPANLMQITQETPSRNR